MVFEKMLVGYTALDEPDALLLDELSNQNMEISHFLVRRWKTMVYNQVDSFRVPDLLDAHLTENFDRQRSRTILSHRHIRRQNSNLPRMMDIPSSVSLDTDDLLCEGKRIIVQDSLRQLGQEAGRKLPLLKMNLDPLQELGRNRNLNFCSHEFPKTCGFRSDKLFLG